MTHSLIPIPTELKLQRGLKQLVVRFPDGMDGVLSAEYLRVHSPSAEVTGHSSGEGILVSGKQQVAIDNIEPIGRYAVRLIFDDGHSTGLYTWPILYELCRDREKNWQRYLARLEQEGQTRAATDPDGDTGQS